MLVGINDSQIKKETPLFLNKSNCIKVTDKFKNDSAASCSALMEPIFTALSIYEYGLYFVDIFASKVQKLYAKFKSISFHKKTEGLTSRASCRRFFTRSL